MAKNKKPRVWHIAETGADYATCGALLMGYTTTPKRRDTGCIDCLNIACRDYARQKEQIEFMANRLGEIAALSTPPEGWGG